MRMSKIRRGMGEEAWAEYQRIRVNAKANAWKTRNARSVVEWRRRAKRRLIEYKGGKCMNPKCGYDKDCPTAYAFHHRDPSKKEFSIGGSTRSFEVLKAEVDKCDLLCVRCHAEIHDAEYVKKVQERLERINGPAS